MSSISEMFFKGIGCFVGFVFIILTSAILRGWVLTKLWFWFVVPFGAPFLGLAHGIGISLICGYLTYQFDKKYPEDEECKNYNKYGSIGFLFLYPLMALLFGWITKEFMPVVG